MSGGDGRKITRWFDLSLDFWWKIGCNLYTCYPMSVVFINDNEYKKANK